MKIYFNHNIIINKGRPALLSPDRSFSFYPFVSRSERKSRDNCIPASAKSVFNECIFSHRTNCAASTFSKYSSYFTSIWFRLLSFFTYYPNPSNISTGLFVVRSVSNLTILDLSNNPLDHKSAEIIETFIGRSPKIQSIKLLFSFSFFLSSLIFSSSSSSSSSFYLFCFLKNPPNWVRAKRIPFNFSINCPGLYCRRSSFEYIKVFLFYNFTFSLLRR